MRAVLRAAGLERVGGAGVRREPPARAGALVHGAAHDRVPEAVSTPRAFEEPGGDRLVERSQVLLEAGGGQREVQVLPGNRRAVHERACGRAQGGELLLHGSHDLRRDAARVAGELGQVERVAAAQALQRRRVPGHLLGAQRREREVDQQAAAGGGLERAEQRGGRAAVGERDQHAAARWLAQQGREGFRVLVREVVDDGDDGRAQVVERVRHAHPLRAGQVGERVQQGRLADAGLPVQGHERRGPQLPHGLPHRVELWDASDDGPDTNPLTRCAPGVPRVVAHVRRAEGREHAQTPPHPPPRPARRNRLGRHRAGRQQRSRPRAIRRSVIDHTCGPGAAATSSGRRARRARRTRLRPIRFPSPIDDHQRAGRSVALRQGPVHG